MHFGKTVSVLLASVLSACASGESPLPSGALVASPHGALDGRWVGEINEYDLPDMYAKRALIIQGPNCWWGYDTYKESERWKMAGTCTINESRSHVHFKHNFSRSEVDLVLKDGVLIGEFTVLANWTRKWPKVIVMHRE